jgi:hypothetical protein
LYLSWKNLAEWHKPLDTKPHGCGVAILRRIDHGIHDALAILFQDSLGKQGRLGARTLRSAGRVAALAFLEAAVLLGGCFVKGHGLILGYP